ncbi:MAG: hypothetical protein IJ489_11470 [Clostridia bacterium]|nr:hypothetical protein [Clostridia bacterium]
MRYAVRNLFRLKASTVFSLLIAFSIFFLSTFGFFLRLLCENNRKRFYGVLDGSVHATDEQLNPYLTYDAALTLAEDADVITRVSAVKRYTAFFSDVRYVGYGTYRRARYSGEERTEDGKANYLKGFSVVAVTSMDILEEVYSGKLTLEKGSFITDGDTQNKIVISKELAEENGLSVGDILTLDTLSLFQTEAEAVRFQLTEDLYDRLNFDYEYVIGGIYTHAEDNSAAVSEPWNLHSNTVYVPITTMIDASESEGVQHLFHDEGYYALSVNPTVIPDALYLHLSDMNETEILEREINAIGFAKTVKLTEFVSDTASSPSARLSDILSYTTVGLIAVGFVVLGLSVFFNMRVRRRELAVLTALGKKRNAVSVSFFLEIALILLVALVLSGIVMIVTIYLCEIPLTEYLYTAEISSKFLSETADIYLFENTAGGNLIVASVDITRYILPCLRFALVSAALLMVFLYVVIRSYCHRIHPLYDIGGKE